LREKVKMKTTDVKVKCIREIKIPSLGLHCLVGEEYSVPLVVADGYDDCFKKMETKPKNKARATEENK
tara:strand:- start:2879 stop:3082 length:204 start_codon:yes stop_codon:yes gene_type:complete